MLETAAEMTEEVLSSFKSTVLLEDMLKRINGTQSRWTMSREIYGMRIDKYEASRLTFCSDALEYPRWFPDTVGGFDMFTHTLSHGT